MTTARPATAALAGAGSEARQVVARPAAHHPARAALIGVAALSVLVAGIEMALLADAGGPFTWLREIYAAGGLVYAGAGVIAWWRRPGNGMGLIIVAAAGAWMLSVLESVDTPVLACVGVVCATLPLAMLQYLLLAFPSGRLRERPARAAVAGGFFVSTVLQVPLYLFRPSASPDGRLAVADSPAAHDAGVWVQNISGLSVMVVTAAILVRRLRRASPAQRRVLAPLYAYGVVAVLVVPLSPYVLDPIRELTRFEVFAFQLTVLMAAPIAFALAVMRGGFARTSDISDLGSWLAEVPHERTSLEVALAQTLGDPTLRLGFWSQARGRYVDDAGVALPDGPDRAFAPVRVQGEAVAGISYDPLRNDEPGLVEAAGRVVAIAIEQERLSQALRVSEHALQVAARRTVEAGDRERTRIARDLHDGMQAQLVAIALGVQQLAGRTDATPEIRAAATRLRQAVDASARELRGLVQGILPAALIERGLADAVEDLADRISLPIALDIGELAYPLSTTIQRTGYFVVAEALTNAARHARATKVVVRLRQSHDLLLVEVADDGVGGARVGRGLGLRGLTDRVELLGGRLTVSSPPGGGTQLTAELPCES